jgi:hypothetical protein
VRRSWCADNGRAGGRGLCSNSVEKKTVLENLDLVLLSLDEIVDGG